MSNFFSFSDLTIDNIKILDPFFKIPEDYVEPNFYLLELNLNKNKNLIENDLNNIYLALYGSIVPLLRENICGYSISRPNGTNNKLIGRSEFTYKLLKTARQLATQINTAKTCIEGIIFCVNVEFPLKCCDIDTRLSLNKERL